MVEVQTYLNPMDLNPRLCLLFEGLFFLARIEIMIRRWWDTPMSIFPKALSQLRNPHGQRQNRSQPRKYVVKADAFFLRAFEAKSKSKLSRFFWGLFFDGKGFTES